LSKYKLRQAVNYINEHSDQNLTLAEIAAAVRMSPNYFASLFKQSTGLTPHQYVMKCRIEKAKQLLHHQQLTLVEIGKLKAPTDCTANGRFNSLHESTVAE
jgi:AraC family transcriptional regulator